MNNIQKIKHRALLLVAAMALLIVASPLMRADTGTCGGAMTTLPFTDVPSSNIFFCSIAQAYFTGLTYGTSATTYSPSDPVSRQQMAAFITRTQDSGLKRGSRRASAGQWAMPQDVDVLKRTTVGNAAQYNCFDGEDIWVANANSDSVTRVHASDGRVLGTWTGADSACNTIAAAGFIYVTGLQNPGKIYRIDPALAPGAVTEVEGLVGGNPCSITYDGLNLWTANRGAGIGSITRYNIEDDTATTFLGFARPAGIVFDGTHLWVVDEGTDLLKRVNPADGAILETLPMGDISSSVAIPAFDGSNIWVPVQQGLKVVSISTPARLLATLTGNGLGTNNTAVAFDGERIMVTSSDTFVFVLGFVSLWKASTLTPLGFLELGSISPFGVCSDGLHFWIVTTNSFSGNGFLLRF